MRPFLLFILLLCAMPELSAQVDTLVCDDNIIVQKYFSNDDGDNDIFLPRFRQQQPEVYELSIYDRWGVLMFSTRDLREGWMGKTPAGVPVQEGAYFWVISYRYEGGDKQSCSGAVRFVR